MFLRRATAPAGEMVARLLLVLLASPVAGFRPPAAGFRPPAAENACRRSPAGRGARPRAMVALRAACTPQEANRVIDLAKRAMSRDAGVKEALGSLQKVTTVIGSGSPAPGAVAVSFAAEFRRQGGLFTLMSGEKQVANRGSNVCQVKARADGGKLASCSIQGSGGWGKTINVRCR